MAARRELLVHQLHADAAAEGKPAAGWRLLDVAKIGVCKVLDEMFAGSRGDSHERHLHWDVFARVE